MGTESITGNPEKELINLRKLIKINSVINSILDMGKLLNTIMETIKEIMNAEASTLLLYEENSGDLVFKVALGEAGKGLAERYRIKMGQGIAGWVAETKKPIYINNVYDDERFDPNYDKITGFNSKSILCVPLLFRGKFIGVIQAINPLDRPGFDENDLSLFCSFADQAALAVQNAVYFQNALEDQRIKNEISSARSFQMSLLPAIDRIYDGIHVAARSLSARELGGEFYDIYDFRNGSIGIIVGDIHKKGMQGALNASIILGVIKALSLIVNGNPSSLLANLNNTINENIDTIEKISLFLGLIAIDKKSIHFVNTGFSYPIIVRKNVARYIKYKSHSPDNKGRHQKKINLKLEPDDFVIIITDGIINLKNIGGQNLGLKRIMDHLSNNFASPQEIVDSLIKLANDFLDGLEKREDISIIAVKVEG